MFQVGNWETAVSTLAGWRRTGVEDARAPRI